MARKRRSSNIGLALVLAIGLAGAQGTASPALEKNDTTVVKAGKQDLTKRTQVPKPTTNWSKIKDLFL